MSDVDVTVTVPAEAKVLADSLVKLVSDLKAKKDLATVTADVLPGLLDAVSKFSELQAEFKDPALPVLAGLLAGQLVVALK